MFTFATIIFFKLYFELTHSLLLLFGSEKTIKKKRTPKNRNNVDAHAKIIRVIIITAIFFTLSACNKSAGKMGVDFPSENEAPVAEDVSITTTDNSNITVGDVLMGNYAYHDEEDDEEGQTLCQWMRNNNAIDGATGLTYRVRSDDVGSAITFEVTPVASTGALTGTSVRSQNISITSEDPTPQIYRNEENLNSALGVNVSGATYYSTTWQYINFFKRASGGSGYLWRTVCWEECGDQLWHNTEEYTQLQLDEQGWPTSLPENNPDGILFDAVQTNILLDTDVHPIGRYIVKYDGSGDIRYNGTPDNFSVVEEESTPGRDVLDISGSSALLVTIAATDPDNYIRNIRIYPPGGVCDNNPFDHHESATTCSGLFLSYEEASEALGLIFHPQYLDELKVFRSIRSLSLQGSVERDVPTMQIQWDDRVPFDYASWGADSRGAPIEVFIELANVLNAEPWLMATCRADDNFIQKYAALVRTNLNPELDIIFEYCNEHWNTAYPFNINGNWIAEQSQVRWGALPEPLAENYPSQENDPDFIRDRNNYWFTYEQMKRSWYAMRASHMCAIWKQEFAEESDRIKCALGGMSATPSMGFDAALCQYFVDEDPANNSPCHYNMDYIAIGPYFGGTFGMLDTALPEHNQIREEMLTWTMEQMFEEINNGLLPYDDTRMGWEQISTQNGHLEAVRNQLQSSVNALDTFNTTHNTSLKFVAYEGGQHLLRSGDRELNQLFLAANRDPRMYDVFTEYYQIWQSFANHMELFNVFESTNKYSDWYGAFPIRESINQPIEEAPKYRASIHFAEQTPCWWDDCRRE